MTMSQIHGQSRTEMEEPIVFYAKTGCPWCNAVRHLLNEYDVPYEERDARRDPRYLEEMVGFTHQDKTPTLKIGDDWLIDSDAQAVAERLGLPRPAETKMAA